MKKTISLFLVLCLLFSTACSYVDLERLASKDSVYVASGGKPENAVSDKTTDTLEDYIDSYVSAYSVMVRRQTDREDRLKIYIWARSIDMYRLGQYIADATKVCNEALKQHNEELLYLHMMIDYEDSKSIWWTSSRSKDGRIRTTDIPELEEGDRTLEQIVETFSQKNKDLPNIQPANPIDPYDVYNVDKSELEPILFEMQAFIDRNAAMIDAVIVENGIDDPQKIFIELFTTRYAPDEFGAILQNVAGLVEEAMKMTDRELDRFTTSFMLKGKENKGKSIQWNTSDFVTGIVWDDFHDFYSDEKRGIKFEDVIRVYSSKNKDLLPNVLS